MEIFRKALIFMSLLMVSCLCLSCAHSLSVKFPGNDFMFLTSGDGEVRKNVEKRTETTAEVIYWKRGFRIPLPIFGLLPINDVNPEQSLRTFVQEAQKNKNADGVINMDIKYIPPSNPILAFFGLGHGGYIYIQGTAIKKDSEK